MIKTGSLVGLPDQEPGVSLRAPCKQNYCSYSRLPFLQAIEFGALGANLIGSNAVSFFREFYIINIRTVQGPDIYWIYGFR